MYKTKGGFGVAGGDVVDVQIDGWIRRAGGWKCLGVERVVGPRLVERDVVVADITFVEPVVGQLPAVGRPPHRGALTQFLAVHPAGGAVLDAPVDAAVGGDRTDIAVGGGTDPDVAILVEGLQHSVWRRRRSGLPPAIGIVTDRPADDSAWRVVDRLVYG